MQEIEVTDATRMQYFQILQIRGLGKKGNGS